jgi:acylphosphatase
VTAVY